jgi:hypothetical protein
MEKVIILGGDGNKNLPPDLGGEHSLPHPDGKPPEQDGAAPPKHVGEMALAGAFN